MAMLSAERQEEEFQREVTGRNILEKRGNRLLESRRLRWRVTRNTCHAVSAQSSNDEDAMGDDGDLDDLLESVKVEDETVEDDIDRLLELTSEAGEGSLKSKNKPTSRSHSSQSNSYAGTKCHRVYLGGSLAAVGRALPGEKRCCDQLLCLDCDLKVVFFDDRSWTKATTDYLFLRNNYPNSVSANLAPARGCRAYCCQCKSVDAAAVIEVPPSLKWKCRKH